MRYTTAPLPCPTCSDVSFCSLACRTLALNGFHKYECRLTQLFIHTGIKDLPLLLMALRSITQQPVEYFVKNKDKFSCPDAKFGLEDQYMSTDYSTIFNLCTHRERREPYDLYTKTVFACFLLRCLQETGVIKSSSHIYPKNWLRLLQVSDKRSTGHLADGRRGSRLPPFETLPRVHPVQHPHCRVHLREPDGRLGHRNQTLEEFSKVRE